MSEVIKGNSPINNIIIEGTVEISNKIPGLDDVKPEKNLSKNEEAEDLEDEALDEEEEEEERFTINYEELEALREQYRKEGEEQVKYLVQRSEQELADARSQADEIVKKARTEAASVLAQADKDAEFAKEQANKDGYSQGFEEGMKKGMDDGYTAGVKKCKETMEDLKRLYEEYGKEKDGLMAENRRAIFDLSMSIAEKITMTVFTQKSKNALEKMISSAAKEFRKAKNVRVTMSKLDISDEFVADSEILQKCFAQSDNVEYEILDNAERGTLLIEGDSEILDAGVSTQLKMIEELGRGKFREKEPTQVTEALTDAAEIMAAEQEKPKKKKASSANSANSQSESEAVKETVPETADEPVSEETKETAAEEAAEPVTEPIPEPVSESVSEPAPEPVTESVSDPVSDPTPKPISEPASDPTSEPAVEIPQTEDNNENLAPITSDMSADDLMADIDSLIAQAGIGMSDFEQETDSKEDVPNDAITLTKNPAPAEDNEES